MTQSIRRPLRIVIVHQGEDVPGDPGYAPLRYGRLAEALTEQGHNVVRISPSFSHARRSPRQAGVTSSVEGTHLVVPTVGYDGSMSRGRAVFTAQLLQGVFRYLRSERSTIDVVLVGVPPPGLATTARLAVGRRVPVLGDVRDLWPDALAVGRLEKWAPVARLGGRVISQELRLATATTAVTEPMLRWIPERSRGEVVPIGMSDRDLEPHLLPLAGVGLRACFVSGHSHGFGFKPVLEGWNRFVGEVTAAGESDESAPVLTFIGAAPSDSGALALAEADSTVDLVGRVTAVEVAPRLNGADVGLYPSLPSWAYSLGNKVFDYMSSGLYLLHSIEPGVAADIDGAGLGRHVAPTADDWFKAFLDLHRGRQELRAQRTDRIATARSRFGPEATTGRLCQLIEDLGWG